MTNPTDVTVDELHANPLFAGLDGDQLEELMALSEEVHFTEGEVLWREARPADYWFVLLDGAIALSRHTGQTDSVMTVMDRLGQWSGGFGAWDEHARYLTTGTGQVPGRVLRVPAEQLRELTRAWFPLALHLMRGVVSSVRKIETLAQQREALVALGTLAAGLAHEINNPASAATRAADALGATHDRLLLSLRDLAECSITPEQFVGLDTLRRELAPAGSGDSLAATDREDELAEWLTDHDVDRCWEIAPALAAAGADTAWCERLSALLGDRALGPGITWVAQSAASAAILTEVKESTRRISDLVEAVRSYSRLDRAAIESVDVTKGLDDTLVMLGHKLRPGVVVVREYAPDLPRVEAYAGELNQVWTNIIDNAVDAMAGTGTLTVSARPERQAVVVEIADTGHGMPEAIAHRAFDPFYTTKEVGEGTGLGLDISRRIVVERHGGDITIESEPGRTVLRVTLPVRAAVET